MRLNALFRLAFASAPDLKPLTLPHTVTSRLIMQKARRRTFPEGHSASTACRRTVSSSISLPSPGFFSPFPHGTRSLSVVGEYLALPDGPGRFPRDSSCPAVLGKSAEGLVGFRLRGCHLLWPTVPGRSTNRELCNPLDPLQQTLAAPATPFMQDLQAWHMNGLGSSPFARRYLGNHNCFLFLEVLRWFTSLRWPHTPMNSACSCWALPQQGFPIRKPPDRRLFAAPRGLSQLTTSFIAYLRQGIHRTPLVA